MTRSYLDANIFLRYLVCDNLAQFEKAKEIFRGIEEGESIGLVSILVVAEVIWVLEGFYGVKRANFVPNLVDLLSFNNIKICEIKKRELFEILNLLLKVNMDFTDVYLHYFSKKSGIGVSSFDSDFAKLAKS